MNKIGKGKGFIVLQIHKGRIKIKWRNLFIQSL